MKWTKFKVTKLPAQPSPSRFTAMESQAAAESKIRAKFGELPEYMGLSRRAIGELAAESYALKAENKMFFGKLRKELKASRLRTAGGIKTMRSSGKSIKPRSLKVAKSKGAMKAYKSADKQSRAAYSTIMERYTGRTKASPFKNRSISTTVKQTGTRAENLREKKATKDAFKAMGIDDRVESNFRTRYYTKRTKSGKVLSDTFTKQVTDSQGRVLTGKKKRQTLLYDKLFKD